MFSQKLNQIMPSATLSLNAKAKKMKSEGLDVVNMGTGEPDFDTPEYIKNEAKIAMDEGFTKYTPTSGIPQLKEAICEKLKKDNDLTYKQSEIIVSCGAKHSLYNAINAICNSGDEVILTAPYWVTYYEQIKLADAIPVVIQTDERTGFKITQELLKKNITSKTKLLILNSPNNPTGMVYSKQELFDIAKIVVEKNIYVVSDEIYEKLIYDNQKHISIASFGDEIKKLTVVINGVSKAYAMTGWRIGYAAGPEEIVKLMSNFQDHVTSNPDSIAQRAAWAAILKNDSSIESMVKEFDKRRNYIVDEMKSISNIKFLKPQGAFYFFPDISNTFGKKYKGKLIDNCDTLSSILLEDLKVAIVPGSAFGAKNYIRFSYAASMLNIQKAVERTKKFFKELE